MFSRLQRKVLRTKSHKRRPSFFRPSLEVLEDRFTPTLTLTQAGLDLGLSLTTFASGFPYANIDGGVGPIGIAIPQAGPYAGSVFVSSPYTAQVYLFPTDTDGQTAPTAAPSSVPPSNQGLTNPIIFEQGVTQAQALASVGDNVYLDENLDYPSGSLYLLNSTGNQLLENGLANPSGMVVNPTNGHILITSLFGSQIYDYDPATGILTYPVKDSSVSGFDGLTITPDGKTVYAAVYGNGNPIRGYDLSTGQLVFDSGTVPGDPDGVTLVPENSPITGLAGDLIVNTNSGTVIAINPNEVDPTTGYPVQTILASGGSRGDFVQVDPTNGTLLVTQTDSIMRIGPAGIFDASTTTAPTTAIVPYSANSQTVTLTGSVGGPSYPVNGGTLTFTVGSLGTVTSGTVTNGTASATFTVPGGTDVGPYAITTSYSGAPGFSASSESTGALTVSKANTTTTVSSSPNSSLLGQTVTFTALASPDSPSAGTPSGSVDFFDSTTGTDLGTVPLANGMAALTTNALAVGDHTIVATYSGDSSFLSSQGSTTLNVLAPSSLSGIVFEDFNDDGQVDFGEPGIAGVTITLTGTDDLGQSVNQTQLTDGDGTYVFLNLRPGNYYLTETPPTGYLQGIDTIGTAGGSLSATDQFLVTLGQGINGLNYNFGQLPPAGGAVQSGQTATIGFWNNKNGQALIDSFNGGGTSTQLGDWLAATLPNMFGANAGSNDLAGKSNADIAALFQNDFLVHGVKLDAQVLATALSVYATNTTLDNTDVAANYGFIVSGDGLGMATVNVGSNGAAFGVANDSVLTVMYLLKATDAQVIAGLLYNGDETLRQEANSIYSAINEQGDIIGS